MLLYKLQNENNVCIISSFRTVSSSEHYAMGGGVFPQGVYLAWGVHCSRGCLSALGGSGQRIFSMQWGRPPMNTMTGRQVQERLQFRILYKFADNIVSAFYWIPNQWGDRTENEAKGSSSLGRHTGKWMVNPFEDNTAELWQHNYVNRGMTLVFLRNSRLFLEAMVYLLGRV